MLKIGIFGGSGRVGQLIIKQALQSKNIEVKRERS